MGEGDRGLRSEGRLKTPQFSLADNLFQIFIAPIFLCAELLFALGYWPKLHAAVQERALRMRATSPDAKLTAAS